MLEVTNPVTPTSLFLSGANNTMFINMTNLRPLMLGRSFDLWKFIWPSCTIDASDFELWEFKSFSPILTFERTDYHFCQKHTFVLKKFQVQYSVARKKYIHFWTFLYRDNCQFFHLLKSGVKIGMPIVINQLYCWITFKKVKSR